MPEQTPNSSPRKPSSTVKVVVQAERIMQMAFTLPVSVFVGWLLGAGLDKWLHQHWIYIAGLVLGMAAGLVQLFRMIGDPGLMAASAPDKEAARGPGFTDEKDEDWKR